MIYDFKKYNENASNEKIDSFIRNNKIDLSTIEDAISDISDDVKVEVKNEILFSDKSRKTGEFQNIISILLSIPMEMDTHSVISMDGLVDLKNSLDQRKLTIEKSIDVINRIKILMGFTNPTVKIFKSTPPLKSNIISFIFVIDNKSEDLIKIISNQMGTSNSIERAISDAEDKILDYMNDNGVSDPERYIDTTNFGEHTGIYINGVYDRDNQPIAILAGEIENDSLDYEILYDNIIDACDYIRRLEVEDQI